MSMECFERYVVTRVLNHYIQDSHEQESHVQDTYIQDAYLQGSHVQDSHTGDSQVGGGQRGQISYEKEIKEACQYIPPAYGM